MPESGFDALGGNLAGGNLVVAIVPRRFDFGEACATAGTDGDLHDTGDMRHLARPAEWNPNLRLFA